MSTKGSAMLVVVIILFIIIGILWFMIYSGYTEGGDDDSTPDGKTPDRIIERTGKGRIPVISDILDIIIADDSRTQDDDGAGIDDIVAHIISPPADDSTGKKPDEPSAPNPRTTVYYIDTERAINLITDGIGSIWARSGGVYYKFTGDKFAKQTELKLVKKVMLEGEPKDIEKNLTTTYKPSTGNQGKIVLDYSCDWSNCLSLYDVRENEWSNFMVKTEHFGDPAGSIYKDGYIWMATPHGTYKFDAETGVRAEFYEDFTSGSQWETLVVTDELAWVSGTHYPTKIDFSTGEVTKYKELPIVNKSMKPIAKMVMVNDDVYATTVSYTTGLGGGAKRSVMLMKYNAEQDEWNKLAVGDFEYAPNPNRKKLFGPLFGTNIATDGKKVYLLAKDSDAYASAIDTQDKANIYIYNPSTGEWSRENFYSGTEFLESAVKAKKDFGQLTYHNNAVWATIYHDKQFAVVRYSLT